MPFPSVRCRHGQAGQQARASVLWLIPYSATNLRGGDAKAALAILACDVAALCTDILLSVLALRVDTQCACIGASPAQKARGALAVLVCDVAPVDKHVLQRLVQRGDVRVLAVDRDPARARPRERAPGGRRVRALRTASSAGRAHRLRMQPRTRCEACARSTQHALNRGTPCGAKGCEHAGAMLRMPPVHAQHFYTQV